MALLFMDGFDAGDATLKWINGAAASSYATTRFSTGRALGISNTAVTRAFTASSQVFIGFSMNTSNIDGVVRPYINLYGDGGATAHLGLAYSSTSLVLYRGGVGGTTLATYSSAFSANVWYALEISATIADSGGTCVVKLNGATVINYTGDTKNAGTNTTLDTIALGSNGGYTAYFDDLYICDSTGSAPHNTFLGEVRIRALSPSGAGSSTQFTPSTGANYTTVDELPYSATDYVTSTTIGNRDTYAMADLPATVGTILAVQNNVIAKKADAGAAALKPALRSAGTVYYGTQTTLVPGDVAISDLRIVDPATGVAWTASGVNGLEAGFEVA